MKVDVDVIVVGAGPVGLTLAAELVLAGVSVRVLERRDSPDPAMKAQSINVPTAEALDRRGLLPALEQIQRETLGVSGFRFTGHFAGVPLDPGLVDWNDSDLAAHTAVEGARMIPQPRLEALLAGHAERLGVTVRRGVEVTSLEDTGDGVVVGTNTGPLHAGWLVGCDGGHSAVRRLAGIPFPGTDPEITGYQAVVDIADPEKLADGWSWSPQGVYRYGPQPGRIATVEFDGGPADRSAPVTLDDVQSSLRRVSGTDITLTGLRATPTRWTDNTRQASQYRAGRVFLAGDAAHVHPPFGGQGLNLGVGDAVNLGWKLAAVASGRARESLLDTYDAERRPVGAWVLDWTRAQIGVLRGDPKSGALRGVVADLLSTRDGTTYAVKQIAGMTQRLPLPGDHPWTGRHVPDLVLSNGTRLADHAHGGGFLLLDRTPDALFANLAKDRTRVIRDDGTGVVGALIRPDGVVAWASDTTDPAGLEPALRQWAGEGF
ncbi:FAD-dependent monooxygenase [Streptomyces sp. NBC_01171]|uniref:FAD-dependent monooxygenase n=1 Tax=Streptomyces sp. NBC_01171 TaxID=2903757 RepID=UPI003865CD42